MTIPAASQDPEETVYVVTPQLIGEVADALRDRDDARARTLIRPLEAPELADLLEALGPDARGDLIRLIRPDFDPELLPELDETVRDEVVAQLPPGELAAAVHELDSDDAVYVVGELEEGQRRAVLDELPAEDRIAVEQGLSYLEYTAGRLMQRELVALPAFWTVGNAIDHMRGESDLPEEFYDIFLVDPRNHPVGTLALSGLVRNRRGVRLSDIMDPDLTVVPVTMDQEELAFLFRQQDLTSAPVVDPDGRLIGVITIDDVVDVIDEEAEDDLMKLGGVNEDDLYRATMATMRARFTWLFVNLWTAVLASLVISQFEATIEKIVALAVLMPIVASMGGNAGTQTLTVAVRALATHELTPANALRIVWKEVLVGGFNGLLFAAIIGMIAWAWFSAPAIGGVIALAMVSNMLIAGFCGIAIPLGLDRIGIDPAVASTVLLTTVTDVIGFFLFLGLATWILI
ncbi:MAG: magnesium transporter [Alphaproteobacteria bacterium]|nr:magnesium transporter [Alphaproteobacteria bacterium]